MINCTYLEMWVIFTTGAIRHLGGHSCQCSAQSDNIENLSIFAFFLSLKFLWFQLGYHSSKEQLYTWEVTPANFQLNPTTLKIGQFLHFLWAWNFLIPILLSFIAGPSTHQGGHSWWFSAQSNNLENWSFFAFQSANFENWKLIHFCIFSEPKIL